MSDRSQIREQLIKIGLPDVVIRIFDGNCEHPELSYRCQSPLFSFATDTSLPDGLIPFWERGVLVTAAEPSKGEFVKLSLEEPGNPWFVVPTFSEVVADLFIDLWEDEVPDEVLGPLAESFGFLHLDRLIAGLEKGATGDHDQWRVQLRTQCRE